MNSFQIFLVAALICAIVVSLAWVEQINVLIIFFELWIPFHPSENVKVSLIGICQVTLSPKLRNNYSSTVLSEQIGLFLGEASWIWLVERAMTQAFSYKVSDPDVTSYMWRVQEKIERLHAFVEDGKRNNWERNTKLPWRKERALDWIQLQTLLTYNER